MLFRLNLPAAGPRSSEDRAPPLERRPRRTGSPSSAKVDCSRLLAAVGGKLIFSLIFVQSTVEQNQYIYMLYMHIYV